MVAALFWVSIARLLEMVTEECSVIATGTLRRERVLTALRQAMLLPVP